MNLQSIFSGPGFQKVIVKCRDYLDNVYRLLRRILFLGCNGLQSILFNSSSTVQTCADFRIEIEVSSQLLKMFTNIVGITWSS